MAEKERSCFCAVWDCKTTGQDLAVLIRGIEASERVYLNPTKERLVQEAEMIEEVNCRLQIIVDRREAFVMRLHAL